MLRCRNRSGASPPQCGQVVIDAPLRWVSDTPDPLADIYYPKETKPRLTPTLPGDLALSRKLASNQANLGRCCWQGRAVEKGASRREVADAHWDN